MKLLTEQQMIKLNTQRLLAYKNSLLTVVEDNIFDEWNHKINKKDPEWIKTYNTAKKILAKREHISKK